MTTDLQKIEIVSTNAVIDIDDADKPLKPVAVNSNKKISKQSNSLLEFFLDESISTIPICMKYFAVHELAVLICGGIYYLQPDVGVLCLSILPGISIISIFVHFLLTQFKKEKVKSTFFSFQNYLVAFTVFILGASSILLIYHTNTYLSTLVPIQLIPEYSTSTQIFISQILKFPHQHSWKKEIDDTTMRPFNYRISFVGSIIAPIIEESFKYLLLSLTFPIPFIWTFTKQKASSTYSDYSAQSLFIMFIALCGGCGIAIMENLGYLAACQWEETRPYCLPNKNFDILGAGLARGIFSVPFHCVTACIMGDVVCMWMNSNILCFHRNKCLHTIKFILSYPISIIIPMFLHSSFNYWMKGIPFMTGIVTIIGFSFLASRIAKKYSFLNDEGIINKTKEKQNSCIEIKSHQIAIDLNEEIDLTICDYVVL